MPTLHLDAYLVGASDADLYSPKDHVRGVKLTMRDVRIALATYDVPFTPFNAAEWLTGWSERARFLIAAAAVGAVDYSTGDVIGADCDSMVAA